MKLKYLILSLGLLLAIASCKNDSSKEYWTMELIEVYAAVNKGNEATKGNLTFKETKVTDESGNKKEHWYYNRDGQLTTFERYIYGNNEKLPFKSNFYDYKDSLLSYYVFEYDNKGNKIVTNSYDASTNELLRVEEFSYDENNNRIGRKILTAAGQLVRRYEFRFDNDGNESTYAVYDADDKKLVAEAFSIVKKDEKGWVEKWSFRNEQPSTMKTRKFVKFLPAKITEVR